MWAMIEKLRMLRMRKMGSDSTFALRANRQENAGGAESRL
jgi:hypothetical protein